MANQVTIGPASYQVLLVEDSPGDAALVRHSLEVLEGCKVEPSVAGAAALSRYQFERLGYFCVDSDSTDEKLVFNRTVTLRDSWAKVARRKG